MSGQTKSSIALQYFLNATCIIGLCISIYAISIELRSEHETNYKPMCDINEHISCSKVLTSKWSKGFGVLPLFLPEDHWMNLPNPVFGVGFYLVALLLSMSNSPKLNRVLLCMAALSSAGAIYLAVIMYHYIGALCLVCVGIYVTNFTLLILSWQRQSTLEKVVRKKHA